jgi:hypothetical protein
MFCKACGFQLVGDERFCPKCGLYMAASAPPQTVAPVPLAAATYRPSSPEERLRKARLWVGIGCVVLAILFTSGLEPVAAWIGIVAAVIFAIGWSSRGIQFRYKVIFVIVSAALVAGVQRLELFNLQQASAKHQQELDRIAAQNEASARLRAQQEEDDFKKMTPDQHLAVVREDLKANATDTQVTEAMKHLEALQGTPMEGDGRALRVRYEAQKAQAEKAAAAEEAANEKRANAENAKAEMLGRDLMAKSIEDSMLAEGYDIDVNAVGGNHTTLRIKFILVNKAFAYQMAHSSEIIDNARAAGFKKIVLTDGYDEQWHIDL